MIASEAVPVLEGDTLETLRERVHDGGAPAAAEGGARAVRALISVYDKTGLAPFARGLAELGCELVASGGTAEALAEAGLDRNERRGRHRASRSCSPAGSRRCIRASTPGSSRGAIAAEDRAALAEHGIEPFDLVCVNLYPFELAVDRPELDEAGLIEMIDIGGPALLRAAAKNFASVAAVCARRTTRASSRRCAADGGLTTLELRRRLAAVAFARTAAYESAIARWFQRGEGFPETLVPAFDRTLELAYGENPQQAPRTTPSAAPARTSSRSWSSIQGKPLSFNNLGDLSAARGLVCRARRPGLRDREAREPVRGRRRRHDRRGICEGARR